MKILTSFSHTHVIPDFCGSQAELEVRKYRKIEFTPFIGNKDFGVNVLYLKGIRPVGSCREAVCRLQTGCREALGTALLQISGEKASPLSKKEKK